MATKYKSETITVDDDFARFGGKSYAINKINTVEVRETKPHGIFALLLFGFLSLTSLLSMLGAITSGQNPGAAAIMLVVCAGLAFWAWKRRQIVDHHLFLMTSSSEAQAYTSRDGDQVAALRERIEKAMTRPA
jgi:hypothetical protein